MSKKHIKVGYKLTGAFVTAAFASKLGEVAIQPPDHYMDQLSERIRARDRADYGSEDYWRAEEDILKYEQINKLAEIRTKRTAFAAAANEDGHSYHISKEIGDANMDILAAVSDPYLGYAYLNGIPGIKGLLPPDHPLVAKLLDPNISVGDYRNLLVQNQAILKEEAEKMGEKCLQEGTLIPKGTVIVLYDSIVINRQHVIGENHQALILDTTHRHTFAKGSSRHEFRVVDGKLVWNNYGTGKSPVPYFDTLNNVVAAWMWSISPELGFRRYAWVKSGKPGVFEERIVQEAPHLARALHGINLLGEYLGHFNLYLVDHFLFKTEQAHDKAQKAIERAEAFAMYESGQLGGESFVLDVRNVDDARRLGMEVFGLYEGHKTWFYDQPEKSTKATTDWAEGGIFLGKERIGTANTRIRELLLIPTFSPILEVPRAMVQQRLNKHLEKVLSTKAILDIQKDYFELAKRFSESLTVDEWQSEMELRDKLAEPLALRTFVETALHEILRSITPQIVDQLLNDSHSAANMIPSLVLSVSEVFEADHVKPFFQENGVVDVWRESASVEYLADIQGSSLHIIEERAKITLEAKENAEKSRVNFYNLHTVEAINASNALKEQEKKLQEAAETSVERSNKAEEKLKLVEDVKTGLEDKRRELEKKGNERAKEFVGKLKGK